MKESGWVLEARVWNATPAFDLPAAFAGMPELEYDNCLCHLTNVLFCVGTLAFYRLNGIFILENKLHLENTTDSFFLGLYSSFC